VTLDNDAVWFPVLLALVAVTAVCVRNIVRGRPGRAFAAIRTNEVAAAVMGVNVTRTKLGAFVASSFIVGISGAVGAYYLEEVNSSYYSLALAVAYIAMILIGGLASVWGSIVGAFVVTAIPFLVQNVSTSLIGGGSASFVQRNASSIDAILYGAAILAFLYFRPKGVASLVLLFRKQAPRADARVAAPAALEDPSGAVAAEPPMALAPVLRVDGLTVTYRGGGVGVLNVSLSVSTGEVVGLVGPNGAGKTSTLRGIMGFLPRDPARATARTIALHGVDVRSAGPLKRAHAGISLVAERDKVFAGLTVRENLRLACAASRSSRDAEHRALDVFPLLKQHLQRKAGYLSGGQRQQLAIAMGLCADPQVLLVDELSLGLSPNLVDDLAQSLRRLVSEGLPVLMAEQSIALAADLSARVVVLDGGRVIDSGDMQQLYEQGRVAVAFTGHR
jgi:ABC-type branched-subunit amino acid transport system ATPase component